MMKSEKMQMERALSFARINIFNDFYIFLFTDGTELSDTGMGLIKCFRHGSRIHGRLGIKSHKYTSYIL
jgi:hypothetical protein